jgi:hypothetical protein
MSTALATTDRVQVPADLQEKALLGGDLSKLTVPERLSFYNSICTSLGLNPLTRPFEYIQLNGKLTLYARKDCTEQLRTNRRISITGLQREVVEGVYVVTAKAEEQTTLRTDESIGAVPIANLQGEAKANAMMKAETKAKRRVTLSICGLGMLDETEIETIPGAKVVVETAPQLPTAEPTESASVAQPPVADAGSSNRAFIIPVGRDKGKTLEEVDDLSWIKSYYEAKLETQPTSRYRDEWENAILAIEEEEESRG